ncbi:MAG TPA: hypothetical protein K8V00_02715 [Ligilactobacillus acidipiscis]|jgi:hypothetical protein|uniref:Uncharacterized protein n=1 Tax=Ligilactobacillus acidipiscis TaxID=89059 RepID=A0A921F6Z9_9LACO|nr:hypothetical protein [Ligilactobacillus acidipiscis]
MKLNQEKMILLKKISTGQIDPAEIEENQLLKQLVFKQKMINYTLNFSQRTGNYYVSQLQLTEKGKDELTSLLRSKRQGKKNKVKIPLFFAVGTFAGVLMSSFLF